MLERRPMELKCLTRTFILQVLAVAGLVGPSPGTACGQLIMSVPTGLTANPGDTITLPVNLTVVGTQIDAAHGNGLGADSLVLSYDSGLASNVGPIGLGSLISNPAYGFSNYTTNNAAGLVRAVTSSTQGTPGLPTGTAGSLALIPFTVSPTAAPGTYTLTLLPSSGATTTSIVDNNFNTYSQGSGLTLANGSLTVAPVPEPSGLLLSAAVAVGWGLKQCTGRAARRRTFSAGTLSPAASN